MSATFSFGADTNQPISSNRMTSTTTARWRSSSTAKYLVLQQDRRRKRLCPLIRVLPVGLARERECVWVCNPFTVPCNLFFPTTTTSLLLALFTRTTPHSLEGGKRNDKRTGFIFFDTCVSSRPDATRREWVGWVGVAVGLIHPGNLDAADNPPPPFATPPLPHPLFNICFNLYEIKLGLDGQWLWFSW